MAKTIKEIADEIGVSKTAVRKQIANLKLQTSLRKNGNQFAIDDEQETLIKQAFLKKTETKNGNQTQTKTQTGNHEVSDLVCVLQTTIDTLQNQLSIKDKQIESQSKIIENLSTALEAAQALHAGTIQHTFADTTKEDEPVKQKKGWKFWK